MTMDYPCRRRNAGRAALAALLAVALLGVAGCGRDYPAQDQASGDAATSGDAPAALVESGNDDGFNAVLLEKPHSKPTGTLIGTDGKPYDFAKKTKDRIVLLYAGYTNCPDVCPTTVAELAAAMRELPDADADQIDVVMFSSDPERDTPPRMRKWLDQFDKSFEGVTGPVDEVIAAVNSMGIDVQPPVVEDDGSVVVEHGAQVLAFTPSDNKAHLLWTSGTAVSEYTDDLTKLLDGADPAQAG